VDDYAPVDAAWPFPSFSSHPENGGIYNGSHVSYQFVQGQEAAALEDFVANSMTGALDIHRAGGKNVDASCLEEVERMKNRLSLSCMFSPEEEQSAAATDVALWGGDTVPYQCHVRYPEILNFLCFLDVLSPTTVGPAMGPWFMEREPASPFFGNFPSGFFR
jgi:hypothetical protein